MHLTEAENLEIFEQSEPKKGEGIFFYDEHPMIRTYASEEEKILRAMVEKVQAEPKLYVKLATVDSQKEKQNRREFWDLKIPFAGWRKKKWCSFCTAADGSRRSENFYKHRIMLDRKQRSI